MARTVFRQWGIQRTDDFGDMVFNLVEAGLMSKTEQDTRWIFSRRLRPRPGPGSRATESSSTRRGEHDDFLQGWSEALRHRVSSAVSFPVPPSAPRCHAARGGGYVRLLRIGYLGLLAATTRSRSSCARPQRWSRTSSWSPRWAAGRRASRVLRQGSAEVWARRPGDSRRKRHGEEPRGRLHGRGRARAGVGRRRATTSWR